MKAIIVAGTAAVFLGACGGGGGSTPSAVTTPITTPAPAIGATSYANYKQIGLVPQALPSGDNTTRAYANFSGNGRLDLFRAVITYDASKSQSL